MSETGQVSNCIQCGTVIDGPRIEWRYCDACVKDVQLSDGYDTREAVGDE